ncbi:MAG: hypothetical protein NC341_10175 [Blautia sp.]|nr:hypothetical protein [Blautia sp.]MCM1201949.1 hypothetical protein [Bacteroides fragilis]
MAMQLTGTKNNLMVHQNENAQARREARKHGNSQKKGMKNGSINMSELNGKMDSLLKRRQRAQARAMKAINDAWAGERKIQMGIDESNARIQEYQNIASEERDAIIGFREKKAQLMEEYGVEEDSGEYEALLEKQRQALEDPEVVLTTAEQERLVQLGEYQERAGAIDDEIERHELEVYKAESVIVGENASIRAVKLENLKHHPMLDAQQEAEKIMKAASQEAIGMLTGEAQEHIEEELEEKKEEAEKRAEEKEEQEEKIEERKEKREELQEKIEIRQEENREMEEIKDEQRENAREQADIIEDAQIYSTNQSALPSKVQTEIKALLQKMKLLDEDIKGAEIDDVL